MDHTPGPWTVAPHRIIGPEGEDICVLVADAPGDQRLIAAAPELLAALKFIWESSRRGPVNKDGPDWWLVPASVLQNAYVTIVKAEEGEFEAQAYIATEYAKKRNEGRST